MSDIVDDEGKLDLIATGFAEAAITVVADNNAVHLVNRTARVNPDHSISMKVFQDR
jgi:hypothetical protein